VIKILLISAGDVGHCVETTTNIQGALENYNCNVDTITPFAEILQGSKGFDYSIVTKDYKNGEKTLDNEQRYLQIYEIFLFLKKEYDLIFLVTLDEIFSLSDTLIQKLAGLFSGITVTGIYYGSSFWRDPDKVEWCKHREKKLTALKTKYAYSPDPFLSFVKDSKIPFQWLPDFTSILSDASSLSLQNTLIQRKKGRKVVGLYGSLGKWKGILEALDAFKHSPELSENYFLFLSGEIVWSTFDEHEKTFLKDCLEKLQNVILYYPYSIESTAGFNSLIDSCDIVLCFYNNLQSSGLVSKAIRKEKPLILSNKGFLKNLHSAFPETGISTSDIKTSLEILMRKPIPCSDNNFLLKHYRCMLTPEFAAQVILKDYFYLSNKGSYFENSDILLYFSKHSSWEFFEKTKALLSNSTG
tara:strand:+ start:41784 stop:43022 length:1239 start_codon:yes stop_codon:yes gene_type:complete